ncbi:hypothetical protein D3C76_1363200 [compost metagenome]
MQGRTGRDIKDIVLAIQRDGQRTLCNSAACICKDFAGNFGRGSKVIDFDNVAALDRRVIGGCGHNLDIGRACSKTRELWRCGTAKVLHRGLKRRQHRLQGPDTGKARGGNLCLPVDLRLLGHLVCVDQSLDDSTGVQAGT